MSEEKKSFQAFIPPNLMGGSFSNIANIHISEGKDSVVIDFYFNSPTETSLVSRVILSVDHAKSIQKVLGTLLKKA